MAQGVVTHDDMTAFIHWLESKPADEEYDYGSTRNCLLAQFLRATGETGVLVGSVTFNTDKVLDWALPSVMRDISYGAPSNRYLRTFGSALERARAALVQMDYGIKNNAADA